MIDAADFEEDYDKGPEPYEKDEPDCYTCCDAGCPYCGHCNPDDPEHLRAVAIQILHSRMPAVPRGVNDVQIPFSDLPAEAVTTIRELVANARIHTDISWPDEGGFSIEGPF